MQRAGEDPFMNLDTYTLFGSREENRKDGEKENECIFVLFGMGEKERKQ